MSSTANTCRPFRRMHFNFRQTWTRLKESRVSSCRLDAFWISALFRSEVRWNLYLPSPLHPIFDLVWFRLPKYGPRHLPVAWWRDDVVSIRYVKLEKHRRKLRAELYFSLCTKACLLFSFCNFLLRDGCFSKVEATKKRLYRIERMPVAQRCASLHIRSGLL